LAPDHRNGLNGRHHRVGHGVSDGIEKPDLADDAVRRLLLDVVELVGDFHRRLELKLDGVAHSPAQLRFQQAAEIVDRLP
jgi:hypothetical protein